MAAERIREFAEKELGRINATIAMIPDDVTTILDIGCGDGRITERFGDKYQIVGVDYSYNSVKQLTKKGVCASSESRPFRINPSIWFCVVRFWNISPMKCSEGLLGRWKGYPVSIY